MRKPSGVFFTKTISLFAIYHKIYNSAKTKSITILVFPLIGMAFANFNCDLSIIILKYYKDTQSNKYDGNHILSQFEHFLLFNQFLK